MHGFSHQKLAALRVCIEEFSKKVKLVAQFCLFGLAKEMLSFHEADRCSSQGAEALLVPTRQTLWPPWIGTADAKCSSPMSEAAGFPAAPS